MEQIPDLEIKFKLIDTLKTVTEGKVCVLPDIPMGKYCRLQPYLVYKNCK